MPDTTLKGKLLVAAPMMHEATFARTVISILEHNDEGALGVIINRPGEASLLEVVPYVADLASHPAVLFAGGPVEPQAAIALGFVARDAALQARDAESPARDAESPARDAESPARDAESPARDATQGWRPVVPPLVTVDLEVEPDVLATGLRELRVFAGYAGWAGGQLEGEIAQGAWYVVESLPLDVFDSAPNRLWSAVLRRQPWPLSAVATCPVDPTMN